MKLTKLNAATTAALFVIGAGFQGLAHADAVAQSRMLISGFTITDGAGVALNASAFVPGSLGFTDKLNNSANLNGVNDSGGAVGVGFAASVNATQACVGACPGENLFGVLSAVAPPASLSRADSFLQNVPIAGVGFTVGANASTLSETAITGTGVGGSSSDILLTSTFQFQLLKPVGSVGLEFDVDTLLRTWTSPSSVAPTLAGASFGWKLSLEDAAGNVLIDWRPNGNVGTGTQIGLNVIQEDCDLNRAGSAGPNSPQAASVCSGSFEATSNFALLANTTYSFSISQETSSLATAVPEPGSIALLGIALAGLSAAGRKRKVMESKNR